MPSLMCIMLMIKTMNCVAGNHSIVIKMEVHATICLESRSMAIRYGTLGFDPQYAKLLKHLRGRFSAMHWRLYIC